MNAESRVAQIRRLEELILRATSSARRTRLLAERVLNELGPSSSVAQGPVARSFFTGKAPVREGAGVERDAEPAWRLAA